LEISSHLCTTLIQHSWSGVAKGAVLRGAGIGAAPLVPISTVKASYGFMAARRAIETADKNSASTNGLLLGRISWLLNYGDLMPQADDKATFDSVVDLDISEQQIKDGSQIEIKFVVSTRETDQPRLASDINCE
jgi:hypothetical protein